MTRKPLTLALASLFIASAAQAGAGAVYIDDATPSILINVQNVSGSPDLAQRDLQVTSGAPAVHVDGSFGCPVGSTAESMELMMGAAHINYVSPPQLIALGVWDVSTPVDMQGEPFGSFDIDSSIDIPLTWDVNALITLGFNPVQIVESHLATAKDNNADLVDWMRSDQVFEAKITMNAVVWCDNGQDLFPGLGSVPLDVSIFYRGDPAIQYQSAVGSPGEVSSGGSGTPGYDSSGTGGTDPSAGDDTREDTATSVAVENTTTTARNR